MNKIKVIIADDSDFVRDGMRIILEVDEDFEVLGCAKDGAEAVALAKENKGDVILMDIHMPGMDGIEATKIIRQKNLGKVLILTTFDDYDLVRKAMANGAAGYLIKNHTPDQLKQMIKSIHNGVGVMDEDILDKLINQEVCREREALVGEGFDAKKFTSRELDIIKAVAEGLSNREIATKLFISEGTVKNYISTILDKENLSHRTALAVYYLTGRK